MQLNCPFCGWREVEEFHCRGTTPEPGADPIAGVYLRVPRKDVSVEYWQHSHGCHSWLLIRRNPSSGDVLEIEMLDVAAARTRPP